MVISPVGSGKTYFVFNEIIKNYSNLNRIIYLVDTNNLKEAIIKDKEYFENVMIYEKDVVKNFRNILSSENKITVMTYSQFGHLLKQDENIFDSIDLIICDEAHNLIKYSNKFDHLVENEEDKVYLNTIKKLKELSTTKDVIFLTATHKSIKKHFEFKDTGMHVFDYSNDIRIRRLKEDFSYSFKSIKNMKMHLEAFNGFIDGEKCLIYTDKINSIKAIKEMVESIEIKFNNRTVRNLKAVGLWSTNSDKEMDIEQLETRKSILETGLIPEGIDVLIINSAYETGINIKDEAIELVVVNSTNPDTQIQARGRVRKNIKAFYVRSLSEKTEVKITLADKWLDKPLTTKDKKELCKELNLVNQNGRALSWTSVKRILEFSGYKVTDTSIMLKNKDDKKVKTRVSIIIE
ncbi:DEAD/DEAH box helicase family protein [Clostridium perfringens]|nr:DEAD/DEAH box helicase family protein [Clostridium perfringens]MDK0602565.1 DEAD/DEAH box helicase family protein [Clostridium perfringens]